MRAETRGERPRGVETREPLRGETSGGGEAERRAEAECTCECEDVHKKTAERRAEESRAHVARATPGSLCSVGGG